MTHARGCEVDDRGHPFCRAQKPFAVLGASIGASSTPVGKGDLSWSRPPIANQNGYGACTSFAASHALVQRYAILGRPLGWIPSQLALWSDAILIGTTPTPTPTQLATMNVGVQSLQMMIAIGHGIRPQGPLAAGMNSDILTGPTSPGLDQLVQAAMAPQVGEYRIDETASDWTELACIAIDNGIPVYIGLSVGPIYDSWVPSMPPIDVPEPAGQGAGHAVRLDAYSTTQTGTRVFSSPGQYGTGYADKGVWLLTDAGLKSRVFDVYPFAISGNS